MAHADLRNPTSLGTPHRRVHGGSVANADQLKALIRTVPDFPRPGIQFRDITTLLENAWGYQSAIDAFADHYRGSPIEKIVAIESRGFLIGGPLAHCLGCGLVLARKSGKLPHVVERQEYSLEYGTDCIEMHRGCLRPGERCLIVDDLLATGGTCLATAQLVERLGGRIVGCGFVIELPSLNGRERLGRYGVHALLTFEGD